MLQQATHLADVRTQLRQDGENVLSCGLGIAIAPVLIVVALTIVALFSWAWGMLLTGIPFVDVPLMVIWLVVYGYLLAVVAYWLVITCAFSLLALVSAVKYLVTLSQWAVARQD
jgi:hypothetical protein